MRKKGDRIAWATVKITTAVTNPSGRSVTPETSQDATSNPMADEPRKMAMRSRNLTTR